MAQEPDPPDVSVVMSVYGDIRFLEAAVASIVGQSFTRFEFLIVDDGSTHDAKLREIAGRDGRIRLIRNPRNLGLTASLNIGVGQARAPLIARMDADDVSHPTRLACLHEAFRSDPALGLAGSYYRTITEADEVVDHIRVPEEFPQILWARLFYNPFCHSSVMFRKDVFLQVGGYDETMAFVEDYDLWVRMLDVSQGRNIPEELISYRLNASGVSARNAEAQRRGAAAIRERLWRSIRQDPREEHVADLAGLTLGFLPPGWERRTAVLRTALQVYGPFRRSVRKRLNPPQRRNLTGILEQLMDVAFDRNNKLSTEGRLLMKRCAAPAMSADIRRFARTLWALYT